MEIDETDKVAAEPELEIAEGVHGLALTPMSCRFPLWHATEPVSHRYCPRPVEKHGDIYCAVHRPICFRAEPKKLAKAKSIKREAIADTFLERVA